MFQHKWVIKLLNIASKKVLLHFYKKTFNCKPWYTSVIHTFGAKLNRNPHIHYLISAGGISSNNDNIRTNIKDRFLPFSALAKARKQVLIYTIRQWAYKNLDYNKEFLPLNNLLSSLQNQTDSSGKSKSRFVHISQKTSSIQMVLSYIWRYLKRPPISKSRIINYDWQNVTYSYVDKYDGKSKYITTSAIEFILLIISHIPQKFFKNIQYWWIFANRSKTKYIHIINYILPHSWRFHTIYVPKSFKERLFLFSWKDPYLCNCSAHLIPYSISFPSSFWFVTKFFDSS
jgi:hypothetical protein